MKIISWNVNGVRAVQSKGFAETLALLDADCILLQFVGCAPSTLRQPDIIER